MPKWTRYHADPKHAAPLLAEMFPVGDGEEPTQVIVYRDRRNTIRYGIADYPNGWSIRFNCNAKGELTSKSASLRLVCGPWPSEAADA